jgi:hypothetical protein
VILASLNVGTNGTISGNFQFNLRRFCLWCAVVRRCNPRSIGAFGVMLTNPLLRRVAHPWRSGTFLTQAL